MYLFGSKRIYIKNENSKLLVRIGGGFVSIEEFLELYSIQEIEKVEKNDPIKVLYGNLLASKKYCYNK